MKFNKIIDAVILISIVVFLLTFFQPGLLFLKTTTTGGDTASHYPTAVYLKEVLLPQGKIMGWDPGNYAGYPLFYHYFPITFIFMAILSFIIPMEISFKLISVLGIFILPFCAYFSFRFLKYKFPIPIMAACFSLAFLFLEANSMWGGNIPSCLAGEYSYSFSLSIMVLFFGTLYDGILKKRNWLLNSFLLVLIAMSHGYTLIFSGVIALFFLWTRKDFWPNFLYLFKTFGLAFLLVSFWFIPFFFNIPWVTSYVTRWYIKSFFEVFPLILMPFLIVSLLGIFLNLFDRRTHYFLHFFGFCLLLYYLSPNIGMLDIRFIPFIQLFTVLFAATSINIFLPAIKKPQILAVISYLAIILWVTANVSYIANWISWNYSGFEKKQTWPIYKQINDYLAGSGPGRVVYEHSPKHNAFGTERAFESLPYFAKRDTLEGLYMQSSISSPFVFYIQSEVSQVCSAPFPEYKCTGLNLEAAIPHLELFNVTHYIARSKPAKTLAARVPSLKLEKEFDQYQIYRLTTNQGNYVEALDYQPVLLETNHWKRDFYQWFRLGQLEPQLVYIKSPSPPDQQRFSLVANSLSNLPKQRIENKPAEIKEIIGNETIEFSTNLVGQPHLIKVSYHPNWQVEGADQIYLISPSFMLVYPNQENVKVYFGKTRYNYIGEIFSLIGLGIVLFSVIIKFKHARKA